MNGILIIDKPAGITSHDVVNRVRRRLGTKRVGHTGTLDPFATGVMVILVGQATRLARFLDKDEKEYEAVIRFGFETETGDATGSPKIGTEETGDRAVEIGLLKRVLADLRGEISQVPPMYSAKKIDGRKLYELARRGETIERPAVRVNISRLELISTTGGEEIDTATIRVTCSAGTYIRVLAEDIGRKAGSRAHLEALHRLRAGKFSIEESATLDELEHDTERVTRLLPVEQAVAHLPGIVLSPERVRRTRNGLSTRVHEAVFLDGDAVRMTAADGTLIAMGRYIADENCIQPDVVLI